MLAKFALLGFAAALGLVPETAQATCTECDVPEESALLQNLQNRADLQPEWKKRERVWRCAPDVHAAQYAWKTLILTISQKFADGGDFVTEAKDGIAKLYGYAIGRVLFKPTQAVKQPFRPTDKGALSYFVGYKYAGPVDGIPEDTGFAIAGEDGWSKVRFDNDQINCFGDENIALAQGYYYFTNNKTGNTTGVEYSFAYQRMKSGELKIILHHSSIPYKVCNDTNDTSLLQDVNESPTLEEQTAARELEQTAAEELDLQPFRRIPRHGRHHYGPSPPPPSCAPDVHAAQDAWKTLILTISQKFLNGGDFVTEAKDGIAKLYGYAIGRVLFKPTQAVEQPFRPTALDALSYFVGYKYAGPVDGIPEDKGFAIAGEDGWSKVRFDNDQISCNGDIAFAQGYYYFTNAKTGNTTGVEYSFGYEKFEGKWKIVLHHSSIPYNLANC